MAILKRKCLAVCMEAPYVIHGIEVCDLLAHDGASARSLCYAAELEMKLIASDAIGAVVVVAAARSEIGVAASLKLERDGGRRR